MGLPRQDKQQPIIIQNVDLLLPGQIKSKRKPLCTANLYLSAASFRRQGGITLSDDESQCFQSSSPGSPVCFDVLGVSGCETSRSSLSDHALRAATSILPVRSEDIRLDHRQQLPVLQIPSNTTTSTDETQLHASRSSGETQLHASRSSGEIPGYSSRFADENPPYTSRSSDKTLLHSSKSSGETPPHSSRSISDTPPNNSYKSLRKHQVSQPWSTYQNVRAASGNDFIDNNISTNQSSKIAVAKKRFNEDKLVMEVTRVDASSVVSHTSHQQGPQLATTHSGCEDETASEISFEFELKQSQLGSKLLHHDGLSTKGSLLSDCADGGNNTDTFECVEKSNVHVQDETITAAGQEKGEKTFTECDWLYDFEAQSTPVNETCTRPTGDVCSKRCAPKGEETATRIKRVSFKLTQDKEVDKLSHSRDVCDQKIVYTDKRDSDQFVSSVERNNVGLCRAVNVGLIPGLLDTGHLPGYPSNPPAQASCVGDAYYPSHQGTARRNTLFSRPARQMSPASHISAVSSQPRQRHLYHERLIGYEPRQRHLYHERLVGYESLNNRRMADNSFTGIKEEVTSHHNVSKQQTCEQLPLEDIDSVRLSNKTVSRKLGATSHVDKDLVLMEPNTKNYIDRDLISMEPNTGSGVYPDSAATKSQTQSEVNTDYLRRLYSSCGNRAHLRGTGSSFDKHMHLDAPEEELAALSRDVGCINRRKTNKLDNSINMCVGAPEPLFTAEQGGDNTHSACPRVRSVSAKGNSFGVKDNMKYVDRCLFQIDRKENERTPMNKRLEKLIVSNLRLHRPVLFLDSSRTDLL